MKRLVFSFCFLLFGCSNEPVFLKGHSESWRGEYIISNYNSDLVLRYKGHRFEDIAGLEIEINGSENLFLEKKGRVFRVKTEDWIKPRDNLTNIRIVLRWNKNKEELLLTTRN